MLAIVMQEGELICLLFFVLWDTVGIYNYSNGDVARCNPLTRALWDGTRLCTISVTALKWLAVSKCHWQLDALYFCADHFSVWPGATCSPNLMRLHKFVHHVIHVFWSQHRDSWMHCCLVWITSAFINICVITCSHDKLHLLIRDWNNRQQTKSVNVSAQMKMYDAQSGVFWI